MTEKTEKEYWIVAMNAFAFANKEEAETFEDALLDAFAAMPEAEGVAASSGVVNVSGWRD